MKRRSVWGLLAVLSVPAAAHHILGLPHYSYKENYPQAPTLEYPARSGPYEILLTCYPGRPEPGKTAKLAFYIKDEAAGRIYDHPIQLRVLQTFTFGRNRDVLPATEVPFYQPPHEASVTFPDDGEYVVEMTLDVDGRPEVIPFLVVAGQPSAAASILATVGGGLVLFLIVIRAVRIKRRRRAQAGGGAQ